MWVASPLCGLVAGNAALPPDEVSVTETAPGERVVVLEERTEHFQGEILDV